LDVIVERAVSVTVVLQQLECVVVAEVLELDQRLLTIPDKPQDYNTVS